MHFFCMQYTTPHIFDIILFYLRGLKEKSDLNDKNGTEICVEHLFHIYIYKNSSTKNYTEPYLLCENLIQITSR